MNGITIELETVWSGTLHRQGLCFDLSGYSAGEEKAPSSPMGAAVKFLHFTGRTGRAVPQPDNERPPLGRAGAAR